METLSGAHSTYRAFSALKGTAEDAPLDRDSLDSYFGEGAPLLKLNVLRLGVPVRVDDFWLDARFDRELNEVLFLPQLEGLGV